MENNEEFTMEEETFESYQDVRRDLTPNCYSSSKLKNEDNLPVKVAFCYTTGVQFWSVQVSAANQTAELDKDRGNDAVTFKKGFKVEHTTNSETVTIIAYGSINDNGTEYPLKGFAIAKFDKNPPPFLTTN